MTELVPEFSAFPVYGIFDGDLVAFDADGNPDFPLVCERMLMRRRHVDLTYIAFDVLSLNGESLMRAPYSERRARLEDMDLNGIHWRTPEAFEDGEVLFEAVCARELEGIVAKRVDGRYRPGQRGQDEEPRVLALRARARGSDQPPASADVRLVSLATGEALAGQHTATAAAPRTR